MKKLLLILIAMNASISAMRFHQPDKEKIPTTKEWHQKRKDIFTRLSVSGNPDYLSDSQKELLQETKLSDFFTQQKASPKELADHFIITCATNAKFSHWLDDQPMNAKVIQNIARNADQELKSICPVDYVFAAAFLLNTPGAKDWMKNIYYEDNNEEKIPGLRAKNYKIISFSYFQYLSRLEKKNSELFQKIKDFIISVWPQQIPPLIQKRAWLFTNRLMSRPYKFAADSPFITFLQKLYPAREEQYEVYKPNDYKPECEKPYIISFDKPNTNYRRPVQYQSRHLPGWEEEDFVALYATLYPGNNHFHYQSSHIPLCQQEVMQLLAKGLDPDAEDVDGRTPLKQAISTNTAIARILLEHGANANNPTQFNSSALCRGYEVNFLLELICKPEYDRRLDLQSLKLLLKYGADPDPFKEEDAQENYPPLVGAAVFKRPDAVKLLLEHKANPNSTLQQYTALHFACEPTYMIDPEIVGEILKYNPDLLQKDQMGETVAKKAFEPDKPGGGYIIANQNKQLIRDYCQKNGIISS